MTPAAVTPLLDAASADRSPRPSRVIEFLATGGVTPLLFPLAWLARRTFGADASELAVGFLCFHAAFVINDPHFSVTYLLFYRDARQRALGDVWGRAQRLRYVVAGFLVPAVLALWAAGAVLERSAVALGWMIQLMFLLVGWHYVKQGFGVLSVLSARRGVPLRAAERRALLVHAYAAWAYSWASPADPGTRMEDHGVVYTSLPHGPLLEWLTFAIFGASACVAAWVLVRQSLARGRLLPLGPLAGYAASLWVWTVYSRIDPLVVYVIPALHSIQYLYFVWLLKRQEPERTEARPFETHSITVRLGLLAATAVALAWALFHGVPELLDAMLFPARGRAAGLGALGAAPSVAAAFACVNIHHYFMDHVIWRRENPDMRVLAAAENVATSPREVAPA